MTDTATVYYMEKAVEETGTMSDPWEKAAERLVKKLEDLKRAKQDWIDWVQSFTLTKIAKLTKEYAVFVLNNF